MRFTAWFSESERAKIDREAARLGTTRNYVVRIAIRRYFQMDVHETSDNESPVKALTTSPR